MRPGPSQSRKPRPIPPAITAGVHVAVPELFGEIACRERMQNSGPAVVGFGRRCYPQDCGKLSSTVDRNSHAVKGQAGGKRTLREGLGFKLATVHAECFDGVVIRADIDDWAACPFPISHVENTEANRLEPLQHLAISSL